MALFPDSPVSAGWSLWYGPCRLLSSSEAFWSSLFAWSLQLAGDSGYLAISVLFLKCFPWIRKPFPHADLLSAAASGPPLLWSFPETPAPHFPSAHAKRGLGPHQALSVLPLTYYCIELLLWSLWGWDPVLLFFLFKSPANVKNETHYGSLSIYWMEHCLSCSCFPWKSISFSGFVFSAPFPCKTFDFTVPCSVSLN